MLEERWERKRNLKVYNSLYPNLIMVKKKLTKREKVKTSAKKLHNEFNKSLNTAVVAAFGFLIALAWRDAISEYVNSLTAMSPVQGNLISAVIITIIGVIGILIATKLFSKNE